MAGIATEESSVGGTSNGQRCQYGEALVEWRSSEQVENGTPSTSPPYWDTDDDDDCGPKPSELYGKYTWKVDKFSQINKRELRSSAFEVGGYKWYILIYPQGCDVCNHLSLFLCVANHDKLLPGWSHFAQFTIAVVNKDPKKSKYSDTLHRFWKKEHDWGWKKFMELSKVLDGFIDADTLIIKAQVQVIRERADRPFRCLDCQYRRELVRVYLTNVEQICRRFVEERRSKLGKLIEDKARWSSFCAFWREIDQTARRRMSRERTDVILRVVVKQFFIEKEVTSTLVMDSLYSGLKALEGLTKSKKGRGKLLDAEELPGPVVRIEKDMFVLLDDVLPILERATLEPLPPKDDKGPQNRMKDGGSGDDFNKDSIERDERRLTELGRRTIEIFVLSHIFSKIEVAYQEAVALKRQEELIREEEAAWMVETEHKAKRGVAEKEKKSKKKQGKQKRNNRKGKDKGRDDKPLVLVHDELQQECPSDEREEIVIETEPVLEKSDSPEDVSDASDSVDCPPEISQPDSDERDVSHVNWGSDTSEVHPLAEASSSGLSVPSTVLNGAIERNNPSAMDDSSSTCSTDSVPSVSQNGPYKGNSFSNQKSPKSPSRGRNQRGRATGDSTGWVSKAHCQPSEATTREEAQINGASGSRKAEPESGTSVLSLQDRIRELEKHVVKKEEEVVNLQRELIVKGQADTDRPPRQKSTGLPSSPISPFKNPQSAVQMKSESKTAGGTDPVLVKKPSSDNHKPINLADAHKTGPQIPTEKPPVQQVSATSRPFSAPIVQGPKPTTPVVSTVQTTPLLSRSASAAGRLGLEPSTSSTRSSYVGPQSYRSAIIGPTSSTATSIATATSSGFTQPPSPSSRVANTLQSYPQPQLFVPKSSEWMEPNLLKPTLSFGMVNREVLHNGPQWGECSQRDTRNLDFYNPVNSRSRDRFASDFPPSTSGRQNHIAMTDEFPHLDIINDLLDDENGIPKATRANTSFHQSFSNPQHLTRQFSFPMDVGMSNDTGPTTSSSSFERTRSYREDRFQRGYGSFGGHFDPLGESFSQANPRPFVNGQIDGLIQPNQWQMGGPDLSYLSMSNADGYGPGGYPYYVPDYSNLSHGDNGYPVFRPSNGH
ncbi:TNF receptor-associated factor homolog 1a-like isoform X2 [Rhododendron vialii]|uniref:TNF receptor-associated factor homolog 1a-like isoform X2 n=1 Tax=Rhododendron vialii TaxID=182163 RepID=UPI00266023DF|nr:TNF receptor-associated factor homolog 1a-like isoform X2 [Rhododendron vialii]XP_058200541.1 TNF receptor-associated factor homolog 1a-like isoform X2 [Rhododendron vialii]XP_058200542.1 TNF receptor-associated factor homolog 1a-like isoform X2 [Rhododendron vialii]